MDQTSRADLEDFDVPGIDLLSFTFEPSYHRDQQRPLYINAENPSQSLNAQETRILVQKLIAGLKANGLTQGDCVLVVLANNYLYSAIYFGIIGAGGVYFGANPASQTFELNHILQLGKPKFIITSSDVLPTLLRTSESYAQSPHRIFVLDTETFSPAQPDSFRLSPPQLQNASPINNTPKQYTDFINLTIHGERDWLKIRSKSHAKTTSATMFSTSGTSGLPKVAVFSHYALVSQLLSLERIPSYDVRRLISLPFFHGFAANFAHAFAIRLSQPLYILPRFQTEQYLATIQKFDITDTIIVPPIVHTLNHSSLPLIDLLDTIRWIGISGAPIGIEAMQEFQTKLRPGTILAQTWGMTEIGVAMVIQHSHGYCDGSIGNPLPGYEVQLVDSLGGVIASDDTPGELQVRSSGMMIGYKDQAAYRPNAWLETGDVLTRSHGRYYIVGRTKELIKVNGWQVAPAELEAVLLTHPCISDVGVIGVLDENGPTEVPRAYIVREADVDGRCSTLSAESVSEYARSRLASYKALKGGVFFVDYIPKTASGKIQRFKLVQMDQYRHSVTEALVLNSVSVPDQDDNSIIETKALTGDGKMLHQRNSRVSPTLPCSLRAMSPIGSNKPAAMTLSRRRSKISLVDKMKALEASRLVLGSHHASVAQTG